MQSTDTPKDLKLFTDDMLLFSIVNDINFSTNVLNDALSKNELPNRPHEINSSSQFFSRKTRKQSHPSSCFVNTIIKQVTSRKHFRMLRDTKLDFPGHL